MAPALVAIVGPTAAGKTALALQVAERLGGEIICCDAYQLRAGLPILTAKPTADELAQAPHHLVGALPLSRPATAAEFVRLADQTIDDLRRRGRRPILCGGTGLYLRALVQGLFEGPAADPSLRADLRRQAEEAGVPALHQRLQEVDPAAAARIAPSDYVRIERALEVFALSGRPISVLQEESRGRGPRYRLRALGVDPGVAVLRLRIRARAETMLERGVCQEVADAEAAGGVRHPPLGYALVRQHLAGALTRTALIEALSTETAQYARRQRTWFRREPGVLWRADPGQVTPEDLLAALAEDDS